MPVRNEKEENYCKACPYLGDKNDPFTYLSFATKRNYCHHCKPLAIPGLKHQQAFCLSENHARCSVFITEKKLAFPDELQYQLFQQSYSRIHIWIPVIVLVISLGILSIFLIPRLNFPSLFSPQIQTSVPINALPVEMNTFLPDIEPTITQETQTTNSPVPSITPVLETETPQLAPHKLDEPIGITHRFVIHRIQAGESLGNLALLHNTSLDAIQKVNFILPDPVWVDWLVIIPVDTTNVEGLPSFEAYMVVNGGITIEELSDLQKLDPSTFKFYNGLPDGYILSNGEWLLIPHIVE